MQPVKRVIDWNHIYLLGWYGLNRKPYLTTWDGAHPDIHVVVTGPEVESWGPPIWAAPANCKPNTIGVPSYTVDQFGLHEVAEGEDPFLKAEELGGVHAFGWYIEEGFERKWHKSDGVPEKSKAEK